MYFYFVKHEGSTRYFLFGNQVPVDVDTGDTVICETKHGEKKGTIAAVFMINSEDVGKVLANACGAYWPLAKVLRKYDKPVVTSIDEVPQWLLNKIRAEERAKIMALIEPRDLPFDL